MNHKTCVAQGMLLLCMGAALCGPALTAEAQRGGRGGRGNGGGGGGRASANATGSGTSTRAGGSCPANGTTGTTATGATTSSTGTTAASLASRAVSAQNQSQAAGTLSAQVNDSNQVQVQWNGNTSNVSRVTFGLFSANGQMLNSTAVTQAPARASLNLVSGVTSYGVRIEYANGTSRTMYSQLR